MATADVATALHAPSLGRLTTSPQTEFNLSVFDSLDTSKPESLDWNNFTHEQRIKAAQLFRAAKKGKLPQQTRESIRAALGDPTFSYLLSGPAATPGPPTTTPDTDLAQRTRSDVDTLLPDTSKTKEKLKSVLRPPGSTGTEPSTKSVRFNESKFETYKNRTNHDGSTDLQSDWKTLQKNGWKGCRSRSGYVKPQKQKQIMGKRWKEIETTYEKVRDGGDEWEYVPTSSMTLSTHFPALYKWADRPTLGDPGVTEDTLKQWDDEDLRRMERKLLLLSWKTGAISKTGNRTTAWKTMTRDERREWAMDNDMIRNKHMNIICKDPREREWYLGLRQGQETPSAMIKVQRRIAEAKTNATQTRKEKTERKVAYREETTVPIITNDKLFARTLDRGLDDFEALQRTQASTDAYTRWQGMEDYLAKLRGKKNLTRSERDRLYKDLSTADDLPTVKDQGGDRKTMKRFAHSIQTMRKNGQSEVRPTVLFDYDAFWKWRTAKEEAKWSIRDLTRATDAGSSDDGSTAGSDTSDSEGATSTEESDGSESDDDDESEDEA